MNINALYYSQSKGHMRIADMHIQHIVCAIAKIEAFCKENAYDVNQFPQYIDLVEHHKARSEQMETENIANS